VARGIATPLPSPDFVLFRARAYPHAAHGWHGRMDIDDHVVRLVQKERVPGSQLAGMTLVELIEDMGMSKLQVGSKSELPRAGPRPVHASRIFKKAANQILRAGEARSAPQRDLAATGPSDPCRRSQACRLAGCVAD
jgi:hypothetical protein